MNVIPAIDVHGHFGRVDGFPQKEKEKELMSLRMEELEAEYRKAAVKAAFLSPAEAIYPFGKWTIPEANHVMERFASEKSWLFSWAVVCPGRPETFEQAKRQMQSKSCVGIKIHPDAHRYHICDYGTEIFEFASRFHAVIETHSGGALSRPEDFASFANHYPEVRVILSHLGNYWDGEVAHQIRAILSCKHGNLYTDTSSVKSILPGIIEWAVSEIGSEAIFFGTDVPLHHVGMMRSRIDYAAISDEDKMNILYKNAERMFAEVLSGI